MHDAGVLDDGKVRAKRQFLEHAAYAVGAGRGDATGTLHAAIGDRALMRQQSTIDHVDDGRLAGTIMADQSDRLAGKDGQVDAVERLDRAELDPDPARGDDRLLFGFNTHAFGQCSSENSWDDHPAPGWGRRVAGVTAA